MFVRIYECFRTVSNLRLVTAVATCMVLTISARGQDVSTIVRAIASRGVLECEFVGFAGQASEAYSHFEQLKATATKEQLRTLVADHPNAVVATYAGYALLDEDYLPLDSVLMLIAPRDEKVSTQCGCIGSSSSAALQVYLRYYVTVHRYEVENGLQKHKITDTEELYNADLYILRHPEYFDKADFEYGLPHYVFKNRVYPESDKPLIAKWANELDYRAARDYIQKHYKASSNQ